jgi:hypothetical protein
MILCWLTCIYNCSVSDQKSPEEGEADKLFLHFSSEYEINYFFVICKLFMVPARAPAGAAIARTMML